MAGANENCGAVKQPANFRETTNRRALRDIQNNVGASSYACAANKRQLKDVNYVNDNNVAPRRPITRQFASTLANKSQQCHGETSDKLGQISVNEKHNNPIIIDVDVDVPMVEESEEMEECELIKEIEMQDLVVESAQNIDICDVGNPLAVVDYVDDIYNYYKRVEATSCVNPDYMSNQFDINDKMRAILIDWLIEVHYKFELMEETLYLTVNIVDRFLSRQAVVRKKLQLVGVTAMLLACKYEEVSVPIVDDLVTISDRAYTREEVLDMEKLMAKTLQFNMSVPTPFVFLRRFLKAAESDRKLEMGSFVEAVESDKKMELLSSFIIELSLVEYEMLMFPPSLLAAAAIYTAQCSLKRFKCWTKTSQQYTMYTEDQLLECSRMMVQFHRNAGLGKLTGAHRKYSTSKFGFVAKFDPALFLLDTRL